MIDFFRIIFPFRIFHPLHLTPATQQVVCMVPQSTAAELKQAEKGAYEYLPDSVSKFPDQKSLVVLMQASGFQSVEYTNLTGGIAAIHTGIKSGPV